MLGHPVQFHDPACKNVIASEPRDLVRAEEEEKSVSLSIGSFLPQSHLEFHPNRSGPLVKMASYLRVTSEEHHGDGEGEGTVVTEEVTQRYVGLVS